jgi:hypothetical protein
MMRSDFGSRRGDDTRNQESHQSISSIEALEGHTWQPVMINLSFSKDHASWGDRDSRCAHVVVDRTVSAKASDITVWAGP